MIVPCESVQELSPSLRGVGCCPQDFSSQDVKTCLSVAMADMQHCVKVR